MATVEEYFENEMKGDTCAFTFKHPANIPGLEPITIRCRILLDIASNSKHLSFYVPPTYHTGHCISAIIHSPEIANGLPDIEGFGVVMGGTSIDKQDVKGTLAGNTFEDNGVGERVMSWTAVFTKRIVLYVDYELTMVDRQNICKLASKQGLFAILRDRTYAKDRSATEKPLAFISHDSRDKDSLVRDLAHKLTNLNCPVWYDEFSLKVGDSLRLSIEKGLKEAKKCIIVLSLSFLTNNGWGKVEFNSIFTREILDKDSLVLPVWHGVGVREVYEYSPSLADKVGLPSSLGIDAIASKLAAAIKA